MFNLFARDKGLREPELQEHHVDYFENTLQQKLDFFDMVLDDSFEIYYREKSEKIMLYNVVTEEYIDDNGIGACNLRKFWQSLFVEAHIFKA